MQKNQLTRDETEELLNKCRYGILSTIGDDGFPYGVPVNFVYIDDKIYIHCSRKGEKAGNMHNNCRCCFTVSKEYGYEYTGAHACDTTAVYESVIIRGCASSVEDPEMKKKILSAVVNKIAPERTGMDEKKILQTAVFEIDIKSMTGKCRRAREGAEIIQ